ncbi:MAG: CPBP family intramembrane metalloprotease [Anaerolineae bacterium]|jgi:membrane protease YdiL (CAAX protease family)
MKRLATEHPLLFVVAVLLGWLFASLLAALAAAALLDTGLATDLAQSLGTLAATGLLLLLAWRLGWLRPAGISQLGGWRLWLLTLALVLYVCGAYHYAFFGTPFFDVGLLIRLPEARAILGRQLVVGFVEETVFRGVLLYALVRVWGTSRRGLFAAILTPALLFGVLHLLQLTTDQSPAATLAVIVNGVVGGFWLGALVRRWGSLWPGVILHALSNMVAQVGVLALPNVMSPANATLLATLLESPLLLLGAWWLLRVPLMGERETAEAGAGEMVEGAMAA